MYVDSHRPKKLTLEEKRKQFLQELSYLCEDYEVEIIENNSIGVLSYELQGGILENNYLETSNGILKKH